MNVSFSEEMLDLESKLVLCRKTWYLSDCYGTAFYLAGLKEDDELVTTEEAEKYIKDLPVSQEHVLHCLAIFYVQEEKKHMGLITKMDPVCITHRLHSGGILIKDQLVDEVLRKDDKVIYKVTPVQQFLQRT